MTHTTNDELILKQYIYRNCVLLAQNADSKTIMTLPYLGDFGFAYLRNAAFYSDVIVHLDFLGCWFPGGPESDV